MSGSRDGDCCEAGREAAGGEHGDRSEVGVKWARPIFNTWCEDTKKTPPKYIACVLWQICVCCVCLLCLLWRAVSASVCLRHCDEGYPALICQRFKIRCSKHKWEIEKQSTITAVFSSGLQTWLTCISHAPLCKYFTNMALCNPTWLYTNAMQQTSYIQNQMRPDEEIDTHLGNFLN